MQQRKKTSLPDISSLIMRFYLFISSMKFYLSILISFLYGFHAIFARGCAFSYSSFNLLCLLRR